jgi:hypothetical protein
LYTTRFKVLRDCLIACSVETELEWEESTHWPFCVADAISHYFMSFRWIWSSLYNLRLGPASSFTSAASFESFSGYAVAELTAIIIGLVGRDHLDHGEWYLGSKRRTLFRSRYQRRAETLTATTFEYEIHAVPNLNSIIPQQTLLDFIERETKVAISSIVVNSKSPNKTKCRLFEEKIHEKPKIRTTRSQMEPREGTPELTELNEMHPPRNALTKKELGDYKASDNDQSIADIEEDSTRRYSALAPSITSSNASFRDFKLSGQGRGSLASHSSQLPSMAISRSHRDSDWSMISEISNKFSRFSVSSKNSGLSRYGS